MSSTVSPGNQVDSWSIWTFPLHARLGKGGPYTSLDDRGNNMERNDLNRSMCEELFGGKMEETAVSDYFKKSDARPQKITVILIKQKLSQELTISFHVNSGIAME